MHLAGQPAAGPAQAVTGRLVIDAAGRAGLQVPLFRAPGACWCARTTVASTHTSQVISPAASARPCNRGNDSPPGAIPLPSAEQPVHRLLRTVPARDIPPRRTGADPPPDPVDQLLFRPHHGRPGFFPLGSSGSSTAHCAPVRSAQPPARASAGRRCPRRATKQQGGDDRSRPVPGDQDVPVAGLEPSSPAREVAVSKARTAPRSAATVGAMVPSARLARSEAAAGGR